MMNTSNVLNTNHFSHPLSTDKAEILGATSSSQLQTVVVTKAVLDSLEANTMHESWQKALQPEFKKPYFTKVTDASWIYFGLLTLSQLKTFLLAEHTSHTVYPTS
jgi:hypothetical protein